MWFTMQNSRSQYRFTFDEVFHSHSRFKNSGAIKSIHIQNLYLYSRCYLHIHDKHSNVQSRFYTGLRFLYSFIIIQVFLFVWSRSCLRVSKFRCIQHSKLVYLISLKTGVQRIAAKYCFHGSPNMVGVAMVFVYYSLMT